MEVSIDNNVLYNGNKMLLPNSLHEEAIASIHDRLQTAELGVHLQFPETDNGIRLRVKTYHECQT